MTRNEAKKIIENNKADTNYFDCEMRETQMFDMLTNRMGFGIAETKVILASLKLAGAKFSDECYFSEMNY